MIAGSPADPSAEQPYVDPNFTPHGAWADAPVARRAESRIEEPTWEIKGAAQEPESETPQRPADEVVAPVAASGWRDEPPAAPAPQQPEPVAASPAPVEKPAPETAELTLAAAPQEPAPAPDTRSDEPPRKGWWQRRFGGS